MGFFIHLWYRVPCRDSFNGITEVYGGVWSSWDGLLYTVNHDCIQHGDWSIRTIGDHEARLTIELL